MEAKLNVRLDERTQHEVAALVEHFNADPAAFGKITSSDVARNAIHQLHDRLLASAPIAKASKR
ncbi:MAG: hypothetical protein ABSB73_09700 [Solirubrobacteraceae bacterium]|jgi:hypothetical protein